MLRRLLINDQPSFASIGYSHQQLSCVPRGTTNRHSQFHCPKSKISKVWFALGIPRIEETVGMAEPPS